ncbi:alpha-2,8-polysialyltransferase family protein [Leptothermofonsia sp. ETS-13]|uniref:alpha-2,8-polysialyltransferase family protein n=1 Tax=Leptothermofonsia sp. ETS-13 TaxID=3035696 RepID=UPI003BA2EE7B
MRIRFAFVNGIWQLCMVVAAFQQEQKNNPGIAYRDYLILYSRKTANLELIQFVETISGLSWHWHGTIWVNWTSTDWNRNVAKEQHSSVHQILTAFNLTHTSQVDEIWLCKIQFLDERLCADIFSKATIYLYEDGLHTYAPTKYLVEFPPVNLLNLRATLINYKHLLQKWLSNQLDWQHEGVKRSHIRRIKTFYSVIGKQLPIPLVLQNTDLKVVEPSLLQTFFSGLYYRLQCQFALESASGKKNALLLGSNLSHLHSFPRQHEVAAFATVIQKLTEQGYIIYWKEHPRNRKPLFDDLQGMVSSDNLVYLSGEQKIPIEVLVSENKVDLCCSTLSSSLFYLKQIYGIKTVTCVRPLLPYLKGDFLKLSELTLANIEEAG